MTRKQDSPAAGGSGPVPTPLLVIESVTVFTSLPGFTTCDRIGRRTEMPSDRFASELNDGAFTNECTIRVSL
jgi:hypothetical protein